MEGGLGTVIRLSVPIRCWLDSVWPACAWQSGPDVVDWGQQTSKEE